MTALVTMKKPSKWAIDCDVLLYSTAFACQSKNEDGNPVLNTSPEDACLQLRKAIIHVMNVCGAEEAVLCLTGKTNFRKAIALPSYPYKGNRKQDKPLLHAELKRYALEELGGVIIEGFEADDHMAHLAIEKGYGIATIDKDLSMVEGWHYNWNKDKLFMVSPEQGWQFFYRQMLTGDATDNIPGLYKLTGTKATKKYMEPILELTEPRDMHKYVRDVYLECYDKVGMCLDDAEEVVDNWLDVIGAQLWMDHTLGARVWVDVSNAHGQEVR